MSVKSAVAVPQRFADYMYSIYLTYFKCIDIDIPKEAKTTEYRRETTIALQ